MSDPTGLETENHPRTRKELRIVFGGLMLALTLAALDQNIVATALPRIVSDLGGLAHLSWVVTAFLVASTTTTPLYGKFSGLYGRKPAFMVSTIIFPARLDALRGGARDDAVDRIPRDPRPRRRRADYLAADNGWPPSAPASRR